MRIRSAAGIAVVLVAFVAGCTDGAGSERTDGPHIVVTTSVLGDVVAQLVGDAASVTVVMPRGADPHGFQPSAQQVAAMVDADALIVNGAGFEEGLLDSVRAAESDGVPTFAAIDAVTTLTLGGGGADPHFFTDPARMAEAAIEIVGFLSSGGPDLTLPPTADDYIASLHDLDREVREILADIAIDHRALVTNHAVFGYFADRYDFDVIGTVVPGGSTTDAVSARDLESLAAAIRETGVPAIFAESSAPAQLADTLADEVGADVEVVELYSESLGGEGSDGGTYLDMIRTDARRIAAALAGASPS